MSAQEIFLKFKTPKTHRVFRTNEFFVVKENNKYYAITGDVIKKVIDVNLGKSLWRSNG